MINKRWLALILMGAILCFCAQEAKCEIILKAMIVNPSRTKTQKATLKAYLPKEAKPEDVLDLTDLSIDYDIDKGLYYVYKEVVLEPGASEVRKISIKDIWVMAEEELKTLSEQAKEIVQRLNNSEYFDTAVTLSEEIDEKQANIIKAQNEAVDALPQTHIAVYRENVQTLDEIKANIAKLEKMLLKYKLATTKGPERVSLKASWWIILAVIISLGLLSFFFFLVWHKQAGVFQASKHEEEEEVFPKEEKKG